MNCPKCNAKATGQGGRIRPQSQTDVELGQQRRGRSCMSCGHCWTTMELDMAEVARLRTLAFRATMKEAT